MHGGLVLLTFTRLSPDVRTLDQIRTIQRCQEIPHEGILFVIKRCILWFYLLNCKDLMWSDPEEIETWAASPRYFKFI